MCPTVAQSRPDSAEFDSINVNVVPIVLLPGVMGTRIQLGGPHWDPDTPTELLKMVFLRQRNLANLLDSRKKGLIFNSFAGGPAQEVDTNPALVERAEFLTGQRTADSNGSGGASSGDGSDGAGGSGNVPANPVASRFYGIQRGWGGVAWAFYGALLMKLEERFIGLGNFPVYAIGYDWRQSCRVSGTPVLQRLRNILQQEGATKALIVTHSMGGLVLRAALQQGAASLIQGVVHCVMPAHGAVVAYRRFHTGATDLLDGRDPTSANLVPPVEGIVLDRILGMTPIEYAVTQANLPGPVELLPTDDYPEVFIRFSPTGAESPAPVLEANTTGPQSLVTPPLTDIYSIYLQNQQPGILPNVGDTDIPTLIPVTTGPATTVMVPLLGESVTAADVSALSNNIVNARAFQASVRNLVHPKSAFLVGDIINTDTQLDFTRTGGGPAGTRVTTVPGPSAVKRIAVTSAMAVRRPAGDGTVPFASARFSSAGGTNIFRRSFPVKHSECFKDAGFRKEVKQQLLKFAGLPPDQPDKDDI